MFSLSASQRYDCGGRYDLRTHQLCRLLAPYLARRLLGTTNAWQVLPVTALFGAVLLVISDLLTRQVSFLIELPVGSFTTLLGGLLLVFLLGRPVRFSKAGNN